MLDTAKKTLWRNALEANLDVATTIAPYFINTEIESDLVQNKTVRIHKMAAATSRVYDPANPAITVDPIAATFRDVTPTEARVWAFGMDDTDEAQLDSAKFVAGATERGGQTFKEDIDGFVAGELRAACLAGNKLGTALAKYDLSDNGGAYGAMTELGRVLSESKTPKSGRVAFIGPAFHAALQREKVITDADPAVVREGVVGKCAGFLLVEDGEIASDEVIATHKVAYDAVRQITKVESYRGGSAEGFVTVTRSLFVYGGEKAEAGCIAILTFQA